jgi:hypothetical protein
VSVVYLKAVAVGIGIGLLAAVLWVLGPLLLAFLALFVESARTGSGGVGGVSVDSGSALLVALLGFSVGFYWTIRRARRRRPATLGPPSN